MGANSAKYYNVNHRHRPHDVSAAPSHRLPQGTLGCTARTFARGRGHTSVGLGERPGGPNLREGGGNRARISSYLCKKYTPAQQPTTRVSWAPLASAHSAHVTSAPTNAHASSPGAMACEVPGVIPRARRAGLLQPCEVVCGKPPEKRGLRGRCGSWWPRLGNVHRSTTKVPRKMPSTAHPCRAQQTQREVSGASVRFVSNHRVRKRIWGCQHGWPPLFFEM